MGAGRFVTWPRARSVATSCRRCGNNSSLRPALDGRPKAIVETSQAETSDSQSCHPLAATAGRMAGRRNSTTPGEALRTERLSEVVGDAFIEATNGRPDQPPNGG